VYTIGYGNRTIEAFVDLLRRFAIDAVCDVRSTPYSRRFPEYGREMLRGTLKSEGIVYVDLGTELGARPDDEDLYVDGRASYARMAKSTRMANGLRRIVEGTRRFRVAIMCAEREPLDCHRAILVAPMLIAHGLRVEHIDRSGQLLDHGRFERRLVQKYALEQISLLEVLSDDDALRRAYEARGAELAFDKNAAVEPLTS
jgi:uncharacterized protein (DUF488 family)